MPVIVAVNATASGPKAGHVVMVEVATVKENVPEELTVCAELVEPDSDPMVTEFAAIARPMPKPVPLTVNDWVGMIELGETEMCGFVIVRVPEAELGVASFAVSVVAPNDTA
jgi:hypothetical protein